MLVLLQFPPGVVKNATPYVRKGTWENCNLIRWDQQSARAIGGWVRRQSTLGVDIAPLAADITTEAYRDAFAWRSLAQDQYLVLGSNKKLQFVSQSGVVTDITPVATVPTGKDASTLAGYGQGVFGAGNYGVANNLTGQAALPPRRWAATNFGERLLYCQRSVGALYSFNASLLSSTAIASAPIGFNDVIVTDQRIVLGVAPAAGPRLVSWSDQEDFNDWTSAVDNQAGDQTLAGTGRLLRAINVLEQVLIVGEDDANVARYVGPPYVFSFSLAGRNCGTVSAEAVVGTERFAVWWGNRQFWLYDGSLKPLDCPIMDYIYDDINFAQVSKVSGFTISKYSEVWWLYQSDGTTTTECDSYVCWNYRGDYWTFGKIDRTAGLDSGTLLYPVMVSSDALIYNHEQEGVMPMGDVFIESNGIDMGQGDLNSAVRYIYPDTENQNDVSMTIKGRQFPTGAVNTYGPYAYNNPTPTRAMGRELKFRFTFASADAEVGNMRVDVAPIGTGRR